MDEPTEEDRVFEVEGMKVILGPEVCSSIKAIDIGYEEYEWGDDLVIVSK